MHSNLYTEEALVQENGDEVMVQENNEEALVQENGDEVMVDITKEQSEKEVQYKMSVKLLKILMQRGIITDIEYAQIDRLNQDSFSPTLSKVYA